MALAAFRRIPREDSRRGVEQFDPLLNQSPPHLMCSVGFVGGVRLSAFLIACAPATRVKSCPFLLRSDQFRPLDL
jgi:hypothetical protein